MSRTSPHLRPALALASLVGVLLLAAVPLAGQAALETEQLDVVPVPDAIVARNVPPIPRDAFDDLTPYENIRTAVFADWHPKERRMLIRTRFANTVQLHELAMPMGARTQLTFFEERVGGGEHRPSNPEQIVFTSDLGGAENFQIYLLHRGTGKWRLLTDGRHRHISPQWSNDGKLLAYMGNARNGRDFDLYVVDPDRPQGGARRVADLSGSWELLDWSPDDRRLLLIEEISANESYLHWVDLASGKVHPLTPPKGGEKASYQGGEWSRDGRSVYTATDRGAEFLRMVRLPVAEGGRPGEPEVLAGDIPWNVEQFDLSDDGTLLAFFVNEDGISRLRLLETASGRMLPAPEIPAGDAGGLDFRPGSRELSFHVSWARAPSDVYSYDPATGKVERWTASEAGGLPTERFVVPELVRYPTFDEERPGVRRTIPAWVYRPPADRFPGKRPVYVDIHGGPESQERPSFQGSSNYIVNELGVVLVYPNVRGSSGYGKTYLALDNADKREDSVKDVGALLDWIATQPDLDASRVMVAGGSYGGYMVLASLIHYGDRLRAGYDTVGISNFLTFLQNTQEYRRDLRRAEYGDERDPKMRAYFERIAPQLSADRIRKPMLVAQGANDPRVPLSESDQIVEAVAKNGVPVWYVVAKNEGHGFNKKENTDYLRVVLFEFMRRHLIGGGEGQQPSRARGAGGS
jgi:dipeptidyl aminopeptidase/acylaminoacyl peptidase